MRRGGLPSDDAHRPVSGERSLTAEALRSLPAVLTVRELNRQGYRWPSQRLARLAAAGLVRRKGYGVYHNPFGGPWDSLEAARALFPVALVAGATVLHDTGVITQIPAETHLIVVGQRSVPKIAGMLIERRPYSWLYARSDAGDIVPPLTPPTGYPLPSLTARAAWREMCASGRTWGLAEDDLDFRAVDQDDEEGSAPTSGPGSPAPS